MRKIDEKLVQSLPEASRGDLPAVDSAVHIPTKKGNPYDYLKKALGDSPELLQALEEALDGESAQVK